MPYTHLRPSRCLLTNDIIETIRSDSRFCLHPSQGGQAVHAENYVCRSNGRTLAVEKGRPSDTNLVFLSTGIALPNYVKQREVKGFDPNKRDNGINSNLIWNLTDKPTRVEVSTLSAAREIIDLIAAAP